MQESVLRNLLSATRLPPLREARGFASPPRDGFAFIMDGGITPIRALPCSTQRARILHPSAMRHHLEDCRQGFGRAKPPGPPLRGEGDGRGRVSCARRASPGWGVRAVSRGVTARHGPAAVGGEPRRLKPRLEGGEGLLGKGPSPSDQKRGISGGSRGSLLR